VNLINYCGTEMN